MRDDSRKKLFERGFFTLFQYSALYEDHHLCPPSFDATIGESVLMCCPVQGFPPPHISWEFPDGTLLERGSTFLHVAVKTKNDFGRYRCIARSLEKNVRKANITIRERGKYKLRIWVKCASLPLQGDMNTREKTILRFRYNTWPRLWLTNSDIDKHLKKKLSGQNKCRFYENMPKKKKKKARENDLTCHTLTLLGLGNVTIFLCLDRNTW